jgi:hypothetical protein
MRNSDGKSLVPLWRYCTTIVAAWSREECVQILKQNTNYHIVAEDIKRLKNCAADREPGII